MEITNDAQDDHVESDGDDGDMVDDIPDEGADGLARITSKAIPAKKGPTAMISSGNSYERHLKQTAAVVDRILGEGRR